MTERPREGESDWTFQRVGVIGRFSETYLPGVLHRLKDLADSHGLELFFEEPILSLAPEGARELELDGDDWLLIAARWGQLGTDLR